MVERRRHAGRGLNLTAVVRLPLDRSGFRTVPDRVREEACENRLGGFEDHAVVGDSEASWLVRLCPEVCPHSFMEVIHTSHLTLSLGIHPSWIPDGLEI